MSEQELPSGLLGFLQAEIRALRIDLGGRIDRLQEQNTKEHREVREDIADLNSEVRMASTKATEALSIAHEIKVTVDTHLDLHQRQSDHDEGAQDERNKVLVPLKEGIKEVPKGLLAILLLVGGAVIGRLT